MAHKRLWCHACGKVSWCKHHLGSSWICECGSGVNQFEAQRIQAADRKRKRIARAKNIGTFESERAKKERRLHGRREIDRAYVRWIHAWPCVVPWCRKHPVAAHHVTSRGAGGSDRTCLPLCHAHHNLGAGSIHGIGAFSFEKRHALNLKTLITWYNAQYEAGVSGPYHSTLDASEEAYRSS